MSRFQLEHSVDGRVIDVRHVDGTHPRFSASHEHIFAIDFKFFRVNMGMGVSPVCHVVNYIMYFAKMMNPVTTAAIAEMRTAAAAMSFIFPASGFLSGDMRSTALSMAVFISSVTKTKAIVIMSA